MAQSTGFAPVRLPVASNVPISAAQFWERVHILRPGLVAFALRQVGQDGEDVATETILRAEDAWKNGKYLDPTAASGPSAFANWMFTILIRQIADWRRSRQRQYRREAFSLDHVSMDGHDEDEERTRAADCETVWWSKLLITDPKGTLNDIELKHAARERLKLATLTDEERQCLQMRLDGKKLREITQATGLLKDAVARRLESTVTKLRAVPAELLSAPDCDKYTWKVGGDVVIYRAPTTTGSALARERLQMSEAALQRLMR